MGLGVSYDEGELSAIGGEYLTGRFCFFFEGEERITDRCL